MCGIVGYCGKKNAEDHIIHGLEILEYRGYDSAGISVLNEDGKLTTVKRVGKLEILKDALTSLHLEGHVGIGHTRWATHGIPSDKNAHPQVSEDGSFSVVHNGIIENFIDLKSKLLAKGYTFKSDTDTEVVANLFQDYNTGDFLETAVKVAKDLKGAFALGIISSHYPGELLGLRYQSPLVLGVDDQGTILASDIPAVMDYTKDIISLENGEIAYCQEDQRSFYSFEGEEIQKNMEHIDWNFEQASKDGYAHFMLKEIHEQAEVIKKALDMKIKDGKVSLGDQSFSKEELASFDKIYFTACGTAYHAAEVGLRFFEEILGLKCQSEIASELKYYQPFIDDKTLLVVVSQSGETGDTLAAMEEAKAKGAKILAITNVVGSSIARQADKVQYCFAGPEISVASTKAYTTQLICLYTIALDFGQKLGLLDDQTHQAYVQDLYDLVGKVDLLLRREDPYKDLAGKIKNAKEIFYLGRGIDYLSAKEGALKIKEISYINAVSFPSGELKHGSIALLEDGVPVIFVITQESLLDKSISNIKEVKARGAYTLSIAMEGMDQVDEVSDDVVKVPRTNPFFAPVLAVLPQQFLAYETSLALGNDVDKPRNLAKSVTVE